MRRLLLIVLLAGCEFDSPGSELHRPSDIPEDLWDRCVDSLGFSGSPALFAQCLHGARVVAGDAGAQD